MALNPKDRDKSVGLCCRVWDLDEMMLFCVDILKSLSICWTATVYISWILSGTKQSQNSLV